MKKILIMTLLLTPLLGGCSTPPSENNEKTYRLIVVDPNKFVKTPLKSHYEAGVSILIETHLLTDVNLEMYINEEFHAIQTTVRDNSDEHYIWTYNFLMPAAETTISFKTTGGFAN